MQNVSGRPQRASARASQTKISSYFKTSKTRSSPDELKYSLSGDKSQRSATKTAAARSRKKRSRPVASSVCPSHRSSLADFAAPGDCVNESEADVAPPLLKRPKSPHSHSSSALASAEQFAERKAEARGPKPKARGAKKLSNVPPPMHTTSKIKANTKIQIGNLTRRWGKNVTEMKDSTSLFREQRWPELAARLDADGFVLIRGAIPRTDCARARARVFAYLDEIGAVDSSKEDALKGVISKKDNAYEESFAIKAHCGAEASEREIDPKVWLELGNSRELTAVYKSEHLYALLRNILCATDHWKGKTATKAAAVAAAAAAASSGDDASGRSDSEHPSQLVASSASSAAAGGAGAGAGGVESAAGAAAGGNLLGGDSDITLCPLTHQTWVRLMTHKGATIEHADYYYFKKDTQIFDRASGYSAVETGALDAASQRTLVRPRFVSQKCAACGSSPADREDSAHSSSSSRANNDLNKCTLCGVRLHTRCLPDRLQKALSLKHFAAEGSWHCDRCAQSNFGVYTSWICASDALTPSGSSLAMCPETHRLAGFNEPKFKTQVPRDFSAALRWQIPSKLNMGDVLLFNIKTIHAASVNTSKFFRFSMDTRFMLKCKHSGDLVQHVPSGLTDADLLL